MHYMISSFFFVAKRNSFANGAGISRMCEIGRARDHKANRSISYYYIFGGHQKPKGAAGVARFGNSLGILTFNILLP